MVTKKKPKKLTPSMEHVVARMREGWALGRSGGMYTSQWLQKGGVGCGGDVEKVDWRTFFGLYDRGIIRVVDSNAFPTKTFVLVEP